MKPHRRMEDQMDAALGIGRGLILGAVLWIAIILGLRWLLSQPGEVIAKLASLVLLVGASGLIVAALRRLDG